MNKTTLHILFTALLFPFYANALDCSANVLAVRIIKNGILELKMDGPVENNYINVCNVVRDYNGISQDACKGWLSLALTAKASGKHIKLWDVEGGTCATGATIVVDRISIAQ